jgi:hypothetical protein
MYASISGYQACVMPVYSTYELMHRVYEMLSICQKKLCIVFLPSCPGLSTHTLKSTLQYLAPYCPYCQIKSNQNKIMFTPLSPGLSKHTLESSLLSFVLLPNKTEIK